MSELQWLVGLTLQVDPDSVRDYRVDLTQWLEGDNLASFEVESEACVANGVLVGPKTGSFRVESVQKGAKVTVKVVTMTGQREDFTTFFEPVER